MGNFCLTVKQIDIRTKASITVENFISMLTFKLMLNVYTFNYVHVIISLRQTGEMLYNS